MQHRVRLLHGISQITQGDGMAQSCTLHVIAADCKQPSTVHNKQQP